MYKVAEAEINRGLSLFPRLLLALCASIFGAVMILVAPDDGKAAYFYGFGAFCFLIAVACINRGRMRRIVGSVIGAALFVVSAAYLVYEIVSGAPLLATRSEPSITNAALCLLLIGVPGASYAWRVRFGLRTADAAAGTPTANV